MAFCRRCGRALMGGFRVCPVCQSPVLQQVAAAIRRCVRCARDLTLEPPSLALCPSCKAPL